MPRPRRDGTPARSEPNKRRLTEAFIKTVQPDSGRVVVYWDTFQRGLALSVQPCHYLFAPTRKKGPRRLTAPRFAVRPEPQRQYRSHVRCRPSRQAPCCPTVCAAFWTSVRLSRRIGAVGIDERPIRPAFGISSRSTSSRFASSSTVNAPVPVTLPPDRLRLATRPSLTGSEVAVKTIGCCLCSNRSSGAAAGDYHRDGAVNQLRRECRQPIILVVRPAIFDLHVAAFDIAALGQAIAERSHEAARSVLRRAGKKTDHRYHPAARAPRAATLLSRCRAA
jgi:hypothetical protein